MFIKQLMEEQELEMAKLRVEVSTNKVGSNQVTYLEIPDEEMEYLEDKDIEEMAMEKLWEMINFEYEIEV
jgi:hypothetical protein